MSHDAGQRGGLESAGARVKEIHDGEPSPPGGMQTLRLKQAVLPRNLRV